MLHDIIGMAGLGRLQAEKLSHAGIKTSDDFLGLCCDVDARHLIEERTGIAEPELRKWARMVDLTRVEGLEPLHADLLDSAGVHSLTDLRRRDSREVASLLARENEKRKLMEETPDAAEVENWISRAKRIAPRVT